MHNFLENPAGIKKENEKIYVAELYFTGDDHFELFYRTLIGIIINNRFNEDIKLLNIESCEYINTFPLMIEVQKNSYWVCLQNKELEVAFYTTKNILENFNIFFVSEILEIDNGIYFSAITSNKHIKIKNILRQ